MRLDAYGVKRVNFVSFSLCCFYSNFLHDNILAVPTAFSKGMSPLEFGTWMKEKNFLPQEDYCIIIGKVPSICIYLFTIR